MKIIEEHFNWLKEKTKDLVFEGVYLNEIFEDLMKVIKIRFILSDKPIEITFKDLCKYIPDSWKYKSSLDRRKTVKICMLDEMHYLNLSEKEADELAERMKKDAACFMTSDTDVFSSFIIINDTVLSDELDETLFHEMIHFFQWSTGKKLHDLFKKDENPIEISEEDLESIENVFSISKIDTERLSSYYLDSFEREAFYHGMYEFFRKNLPHNLLVSRTRFKWFIDTFQNKNKKSFEDYYADIKKVLGETYLLQDSLMMKMEIKILLLYGYFKIGFTSLKNHLLGYFDKDLTNKDK